MQLPVNLSETCANVTYPGPTAGTAVGTLVAAPGEGLLWRLWAVAVATVDVDELSAKWAGGIAIAEGSYWLYAAAADGFGAGTFWWPGGYRLPENTAIDWRLTAASGPITVRIMCYYVREYA